MRCTILIELTNGRNLDIWINHAELLKSLQAKDLIRFYYRYSFALTTIVLCNEPLYPSLPRAGWCSHDDEGVVIRNYSGCNSCLILAMPILLSVLAHCLGHVDHLLQWQWLCYLRSQVLVYLSNMIIGQSNTADVLLALVLSRQGIPLG